MHSSVPLARNVSRKTAPQTLGKEVELPKISPLTPGGKGFREAGDIFG